MAGNGKNVAVGIDLGTCTSSVAVFEQQQGGGSRGKVRVVLDPEGRPTIPSVVAFTPAKQLVGQRALDQITQNPENTISGM